MWIEDPDGVRIVLVEVPADHPLRRDLRSARPAVRAAGEVIPVHSGQQVTTDARVRRRFASAIGHAPVQSPDARRGTLESARIRGDPAGCGLVGHCARR
jgi:hypothetical protein